MLNMEVLFFALYTEENLKLSRLLQGPRLLLSSQIWYGWCLKQLYIYIYICNLLTFCPRFPFTFPFTSDVPPMQITQTLLECFVYPFWIELMHWEIFCIKTYIVVPFWQTKTAKSMVGLSLSVDSSQSLNAAEYLKRRGSALVPALFSHSHFLLCFSF